MGVAEETGVGSLDVTMTGGGTVAGLWLVGGLDSTVRERLSGLSWDSQSGLWEQR